jgi:hypothetical protein
MATKTVEKRTQCRTCKGGLIYHDSRSENDDFWAHFDRPLSETAGHNADPDPALVEYVEVS